MLDAIKEYGRYIATGAPTREAVTTAASWLATRDDNRAELESLITRLEANSEKPLPAVHKELARSLNTLILLRHIIGAHQLGRNAYLIALVEGAREKFIAIADEELTRLWTDLDEGDALIAATVTITPELLMVLPRLVLQQGWLAQSAQPENDRAHLLAHGLDISQFEPIAQSSAQ